MPINKQLLELIRQNSSKLIKLELGDLDLQDSDLTELAEALSSNTVICSIVLSGNNITDVGLQFLLNQRLGRAFQLDLSRNTITIDGWRYFAEHNKQFTYLIVTGSLLGDEAAIALAENTFLHSLNLSSNNITDRATEKLATNGSIVELLLVGNKISGYGANKLFSNSNLRVLYLARNQITNLDDKILSFNKTLRSLSLDNNPLTKADIIAVVQCLSLQSLSLERLYLEDNYAAILAQSLTLTTLYLGHNNFTDDGARIICKNPRLVNVSMMQNKLQTFPCVATSPLAKTVANVEHPVCATLSV